MSSVDRLAMSASAEKAEGEGGRPEGTGTGFERETRVKWETRFERGGFYETDGHTTNIMASQQHSFNETDGSPIPEGNAFIYALLLFVLAIDVIQNYLFYAGCSDLVSHKGVVTGVARRCWTEREEAILMAAMKELAATGWKSDNGFRSGYLTRALEALKREFPKTDIILDRSGVGFNADGEYKIDIDDEQWAQVVQKDSNAKYMRTKSWPMLSDWKKIFGKDRAEGLKGMDTGKAVQKIYGSNAAVGESSAMDSPITLEELFPDEVFPSGVMPEMVDECTSAPGHGRANPRVHNKAPKKRKTEDKMDCVLALMNRIHEDTNERLKDISSRIGYEFDLSTKRTEVFNQLKGMPGLTIKQQFYAAKKLVKEPELMDLFRGLDELARPAFVLDLLETDGMI
ncbi:hypothetical protein SASPL_144898 [Salvia splendens]|uniref:Myb/SANT-like domain-containing protein n=1 Tax=Salvia splendens TaxID=180675 RepID=A0A8X8WHV5_SALSN|nr:hypothetical protein SASPL_144898 [Salvia splendens]